MPLDAIPSHIPNALNTQWSSVSSFFEERLWSHSLRKKLGELTNLPENWNSYGSRRIQQEAIETTAKLLSDLVKIDMPEPQIFPVSGGGVQLEWENAKCELEIEILPDRSIEYLIVDEQGDMHEGKLPQYNNFVEVACLTNWFMSEKSSINDLLNVYAPTS